MSQKKEIEVKTSELLLYIIYYMILYYIYLYIYILYISYCPCPLSKFINSRRFSQDGYAINRLKYWRQSQTTYINIYNIVSYNI